jgi:hypothetical protein
MSGSTVWVSPSATTYSCVCEECLEGTRGRSMSFLEAVRLANVRGSIAIETDVAFAHCAAGHEIVLRRGAGLPQSRGPDSRQLQLA